MTEVIGWTHSEYRVKCRIARMEYRLGLLGLPDYFSRVFHARFQHNLWRGRTGVNIRTAHKVQVLAARSK
jgi:hypothetical protein